MVIVYCDGGCSWNGTEYARTYASFVIGDEKPKRVNQLNGAKTNNEAEYHALIEALRECYRRRIRGARVLMDSALVVNQVNGRWKVKEASLKPLCKRARAGMQWTGATLEWVDRDAIVARLGH